jgi:protein TonB
MSQKKSLRAYVPKIIGGLLASVAVFFLVKMIVDMVSQKSTKSEKKVQLITILKPPPPPPPPPPKLEKPPEPEVKEKIKEPEPEPDPEPIPESRPDDSSPGGDAGPGNGSGPCIGANCLPGGGGGGGVPGSVNAWYGGLVKKEILSIIANHEELRHKAYYAIVKVWVKPDGAIDRIEIAKGSDDTNIDEVLTRILAKLKSIGEPPPANMPQPIKLKIKSSV